MIRIETQRTFLRQLTPNDAENFYQLNLDPDVLKYTGDQPFKTVLAAENFLKNYDQYMKFGVGRLAIIDKAENTFIGWSGLKYTEELDEYDIGFRLFRKYWNKGYATETASACIDFGFKERNVSRIVGRVRVENLASINVLQKIGLTLKKTFDFGGHEGLIYEITKADYAQKASFR